MHVYYNEISNRLQVNFFFIAQVQQRHEQVLSHVPFILLLVRVSSALIRVPRVAGQRRKHATNRANQKRIGSQRRSFNQSTSGNPHPSKAAFRLSGLCEGDAETSLAEHV